MFVTLTRDTGAEIDVNPRKVIKLQSFNLNGEDLVVEPRWVTRLTFEGGTTELVSGHKRDVRKLLEGGTPRRDSGSSRQTLPCH